jgi:urease accessory protein
MVTDSSSLMLLLNWMSPTFPIGGFAYSHGLEQAISDGRLTTADDVEQWISDLLQHGSGWNDAVFFARCWDSDIVDLNALALALCSSSERFHETTQLGRNFNIAAAVWTDAPRRDAVMAYAVAAGSTCKTFGIPQGAALTAFLQGFCAALVSVAVRLVPLGQTRGLHVLRALSHVIPEVVERAKLANLDDIGGDCIAAEIASMRHETLEPRIFRT